MIGGDVQVVRGVFDILQTDSDAFLALKLIPLTTLIASKFDMPRLHPFPLPLGIFPFIPLSSSPFKSQETPKFQSAIELENAYVLRRIPNP